MLRWFIAGFCIIKMVYQFILMYIANAQRKKPLPAEVADIYDAKRYQQFLEYKKEQRILSFKETMVSLCIDLVIIFSPFFQYMELWFSKNPYVLFAGTFFVLTFINGIFDFWFEWKDTFEIEEKYGMNKKTKKEFMKDYAIENGLNLVVSLGLFLPLIYVCEHISEWTHQFSISYGQSFLIVAGLFAGFGILILLFSMLSILALKKQYTFTELEDGELRSQIEYLMRDSKKKVKKIEVYNESKKSNSKNAFLLKLLNYRQFGIADNFILENSERELLGVLAHEVGHLKHKKSFYNYSCYGILIVAFLFVVFMISNGNMFVEFSAWILDSFSLHQNAYYVYFVVYSYLISPIVFLVDLYTKYITRMEEYEADANACKEGYGEDLIQLFKDISKDELMDVYPSIWIERLTYDHPGMYQRILALRKEG